MFVWVYVCMTLSLRRGMMMTSHSQTPPAPPKGGMRFIKNGFNGGEGYGKFLLEMEGRKEQGVGFVMF